jgi:hypothetical protein
MTYTVTKYAPNEWTETSDGRRHPVIVRDCGHKHRTPETAGRCRAKLIDFRGGVWSADWHGAVVVDSDGDTIDVWLEA